MKKRILLSLCSLWLFSMVATQSFAQTSFGLKGGLNLSRLHGLDLRNFESKYKTGYHLGAYLRLGLGESFSIQPELLYSTQGGSINNGLQPQDIDLNYVAIPVMFRLKSKTGIYMELGPQFGFRTEDIDFDNVEASVKKSDFSACAGIGFQSKLFPLGIGARYNLGLSKAGDIFYNSDFKNGVFQLSIYLKLF